MNLDKRIEHALYYTTRDKLEVVEYFSNLLESTNTILNKLRRESVSQINLKTKDFSQEITDLILTKYTAAMLATDCLLNFKNLDLKLRLFLRNNIYKIKLYNAEELLTNE